MRLHGGRLCGRYAPILEAAKVYEREICARTFSEDLELHLVSGYVVSTPDIFIMGRPVKHNAEPALIVDAAHPFARKDWDCWHIYTMAGDIKQCWGYYPFPLPFVSWERNNKLRVYRMMDVKRKAEHV